MVEEIEKTPQSLAVYTDLRMLPDTRVWYRAKQGEYIPGNVISLHWDRQSHRVKATLVLSSTRMGPGVWRYDDKKYAPNSANENESWYFHNPTEETRIVMHNLGYEMTDEEMKPLWTGLKRLTDPVDPEVAETVKRVIERANGDSDNPEDHSSGDNSGYHPAGKHNKAATAKAS